MNRTDYSLLTKHERYFGTVIAVDNVSKSNRCKVRVQTVFDDIDEQYIPWAYPLNFDAAAMDNPYIGEIVEVVFTSNDENFPMFKRIRRNIAPMGDLQDGDWQSATIIKEKDLSNYDLDGFLSVRYDKTNGVVVELKRNDKLSSIIIRNDNTIIAKQGGSKQVLHLASDNISIGSENKSAQPATLGDDCHTSLKNLNDTFKQLAKTMSQNLETLSKAASASPYTGHLTAPLKAYGKAVESLIESLYNRNDQQFPEILSKAVTIDKTLP